MSLFTISTLDMLKDKLDLIQNLIDIKIAHTIVESKEEEKEMAKVNPIDENYSKLSC